MAGGVRMSVQLRLARRCGCFIGAVATVPLGDAESLQRLRERTKDTLTRPAGSTALVDADIPPASHG